MNASPEDIARERAELLDARATGLQRQQYIALLGHELRNPLHAVYAGADLLARKLTDPGQAEIAQRIMTNARRMSSLIDGVLDFARGRLGGGIGVKITEVADINSGLAEVVQEFEDGRPDCRIHADLHVGLPVMCDLGRLQQVASNLLANALTHSSPHSPVSITASADHEGWVLEVWNCGEPRVPADSIEKIFEPFWRHSPSACHSGLGLGLFICREIVRAHHGSGSP